MQQKFISVCSGIEAATLAWKPLGWEPVFYSEIDKFPAHVLEYHHSKTPNLGDMTKYKEWNDYDADVLVGGTPCQSFSVAGLRKGLDDPRGNLMLTYLAIADRYRPRWVVWENVPGVLSSNAGRDFGTFLWALGELGYGFAYRVLDAQYFGVPQRRRRVFVVGCLGSWQHSAAVLFERHSLQRHSAPSREEGKTIAGTPTRGFGDRGLDLDQISGGYALSHWEGGPHPTLSQSNNAGGIGASNQELFSQRGGGLVGHRMLAFGEYEDDETASTVKARDHKDATDLVCCRTTARTLLGKGNDSIVEDIDTYVVHGTQDPCVSNKAFALGRNNGGENVIAFAQNSRDEVREMEVPGALTAQAGSKQQSYLRSGLAVRRLTPIECERLQGFPDNYTRIPWGKKPAEECPDGHRYKALGNSMAVPVMKWIGERINQVSSVVRLS